MVRKRKKRYIHLSKILENECIGDIVRYAHLFYV